MGATTQLAKSSDAGASNSVRSWLIVAGCLIVLSGFLWWARSSPNFVIRTVDPYHVIHVNTADATMNLIHGNRSYVVRCSEHCGEFATGGFYPMDDAGAVLRYTHAGQTLSLPIIEEQTTFDVTGGHG